MRNNWMPFFHGDGCGCGCGCHHHDHDHDHEHQEGELESLVTMVDEETGEEFQFSIVDDFDFEGEMYCVLLTLEEEPQALFVKVVSSEDGEGDYFMSLEDEEADRVAEAYQRILDEMEYDEEDEQETEA